MQLGPAEILVVLVIALLVFGPNKLPEVGRQVGSAYRELRRFQRSLTSEMSDVFADDVSDGAAPAPSLPPKPDAASEADARQSDVRGPNVSESGSGEPKSGEPKSGEPKSGDRAPGDEKGET